VKSLNRRLRVQINWEDEEVREMKRRGGERVGDKEMKDEM
jgi:hypothetical protein